MKDFIKVLSTKTGYSKSDCQIVVDALTDTILEELMESGEFVLRGFMTLTVNERAARPGCNPRTGEKVNYPACKHVTVRVSRAVKQKLNGGMDVDDI